VQSYITIKTFQAIFTLWILSMAVFASVHLTGDPALYLLGPESTEADYQQLKKNMGLDRPFVIQYLSFMWNVARGDFGKSHITGRSAREVLLERFPATLQLAGAAMLLTVVIGVPLGILTAIKRDTVFDVFGKFFAIVGIAAPGFWLGIMLILLLGGIWGWLPTFGRGDFKGTIPFVLSFGKEGDLSGLRHIVLPAFVLSLHTMAGMLRLSRSSMLEVLDSEYIKFARIKGLSERLVIYKHALKNAIIPVLTFAGLTLAGLLNGSVAIEVVFAWPGVGRLMLEGISRRDFPIVQATVLAAGFFYIMTALIIDILYAYVNPRIRYN